MYKNDKDIASEFNGLRVISHEKTLHGGYINVEAPNAGEHVAGGASEFTDHYVVYDDGRIAFDNWYPDTVYNALVELVHEHEKIKCSHVACTNSVEELGDECKDCYEKGLVRECVVCDTPLKDGRCPLGC